MDAPPPLPDDAPDGRPAPRAIAGFLLKVGLFVAVQAATAAALIEVSPRPDPYMRAYAAKQALSETAPSPRVLLVGGSNVAFGVDSRRLGEALGRTPINLGLNAGLGHPFILNQGAAAVKPGDLVILSLEYGPVGQAAMFNDLLLEQPAAAAHLPLAGWKTVGDTGMDYLILKARSSARRILWPAGSAIGPSLYLGSHFDERGDFVGHRDLPRNPDRELVGISSETPPAKLDRVAAFAEAVAAAGGTLVVVHPPVPRRRYEEHRENLDAWDAALRDRLSVPVLTTPREAALPEEFFFDTPYHLAGDGVERRTDDLIARLTAAGFAAPVAAPTDTR
ncbi:hypothetical protein [Alienimonas californiensis]|uniref:Uncharacterized protein n=1 Tax=Alienimonas californiensis TaxID=2527989 RepID=A0A517PF51_9PLAN|nr:hypothetical protein [Alienimonas californiensis]QDT18007.1 hypothetical protein CA12_41450 [Alienimonas californiensis]